MAREAAMQVGKKRCPRCAETVKSEALVCRHCGYEFTTAEMDRQLAFEAKQKRTGMIGCGVLIILALGIWQCSAHQASRPMTTEEKAEQDKSTLASAQFMARGTAGAAVKQRMKNPSSFDLVEADANPAHTDEGKPCWLVAVTYRGTNGFGGVVTERALVWVDQTGMTPLKITDVR